MCWVCGRLTNRPYRWGWIHASAHAIGALSAYLRSNDWGTGHDGWRGQVSGQVLDPSRLRRTFSAGPRDDTE